MSYYKNLPENPPLFTILGKTRFQEDYTMKTKHITGAYIYKEHLKKGHDVKVTGVSFGDLTINCSCGKTFFVTKATYKEVIK